nr:hypothetical protein [uncultured bacterium]
MLPLTTGARVRNAYATYLILENSPWKRGLMLHSITDSHVSVIKEFRYEMGMRPISLLVR